MSKIADAFAGGKAFIPFLTCGDPDLETTAAAVRAAAEVLRARGAVVEECSLPLLDYAVPAYYILACAEASSNLARFFGV